MADTLRIAADVGGTFTDIAIITEDGAVATHKVPSTPPDFAAGVIRGIHELLERLHMRRGEVGEVLHGCTIASNALLERKGAKTALITTRGFRDVLELRRVRVPTLYDPFYVRPAPLVDRELRLEVTERLDANGHVIVPLDENDLAVAIEAVRRADVKAIAVTFLHSYVNPEHEQRVGELLRRALPDVFVTLSTEVLPEIREYERTSTTVVNAYVGPPVRTYLRSLVDQLSTAGVPGGLRVMQSNGGILDAKVAMDRPAQIVECGPAAGVICAARLAAGAGYRNLITFDMGGTTAKASLVEEGELIRTGEFEIGGGISLSSRLVKGGGYALKLPVIDISEVGAGGGSIVWFDKAGAMKVGPASAGAVPGPACYGTGGNEATVTDANVVLGYLNPHALAGGSVPIDFPCAIRAIDDNVARQLGVTRLDAAFAVHVIAIANMMRAIKAVTTYRGRDPRDFVLMAFGGNGGIHAARIAQELEIARVLVPSAAGVFSALGLLLSDIELSAGHSFITRLDLAAPDEIDRAFGMLEGQIVTDLGYEADRVSFERAAELRYLGQAFELAVPLADKTLDDGALARLACAFEAEHERTYGHRFGGSDPIELVSLRVTGRVTPRGRRTLEPMRMRPDGDTAATAIHRKVYFGSDLGLRDTPVLSRAHLALAMRPGPLVVEDDEATTLVPPGWQASVDHWGHIVMDLTQANGVRP